MRLHGENITQAQMIFFCHVRSKKTMKHSIGPLPDNGELISDDKGKASVFISTFSNVFTIKS